MQDVSAGLHCFIGKTNTKRMLSDNQQFNSLNIRRARLYDKDDTKPCRVNVNIELLFISQILLAGRVIFRTYYYYHQYNLHICLKGRFICLFNLALGTFDLVVCVSDG